MRDSLLVGIPTPQSMDTRKTSGGRRYPVRCLAALLWFAASYLPVTKAHSSTEVDALPTEADYLAEIPTIISVTRMAQPRSETPAAVTVIDQDMIRASGARELVHLLRLVPGFQVADATGHLQTATYHGLGDEYSRRLQVLVDGRSVYGTGLGNVFWSTLPVALSDIDHIEVIRGPNSVSFGANAFLGAINIITKHSAGTDGVAVSVGAGNDGIRDSFVKFGAKGSSGSFRVSAGYHADHGLDDRPDDNRVRFISFRSDLLPTDSDSVVLNLGYSNSVLQQGSYINPLFKPTDSTLEAQFEQIRWQRRLGQESEFSLHLYHNLRRFRYHFSSDPVYLGPTIGMTPLPFNFDVTGQRYDLEMQGSFRPADTVRTVLGVGARRDHGESVSLFGAGSPVVEDTSRAFASSEWRPWSAMVVNAGIMVEKIVSGKTYSSPRLAANFHVDENNTVRAAWSKARRMPTLFEQYGDEAITYPGLPLPVEYFVRSEGGLRPETMNSSELGYLWRLPEWDTTLDVRAFHDRISDSIVEVIVPVADLYDGIAYSWRNGSDITVRGAEFELNSRFGRNDRIALSYSRMRASAGAESPDWAPSQQQRTQSVPAYSGSLFLMHRFDEQWDMGVTVSWVAKMKWMAGSYWLGGSGTVPSHRRIDLRLARRLMFAGGSGELALVVQNAGKRYPDFVPAQYFDRRVFLTLEMRFL